MLIKGNKPRARHQQEGSVSTTVCKSCKCENSPNVERFKNKYFQNYLVQRNSPAAFADWYITRKWSCKVVFLVFNGTAIAFTSTNTSLATTFDLYYFCKQSPAPSVRTFICQGPGVAAMFVNGFPKGQLNESNLNSIMRRAVALAFSLCSMRKRTHSTSHRSKRIYRTHRWRENIKNDKVNSQSFIKELSESLTSVRLGLFFMYCGCTQVYNMLK